MRIYRVIKHRVRSLTGSSRLDSDLQREIELHIEQLAKQHMREGMTESDALFAARREFGSMSVTAEQCRETRRVNFIEDLMRDLAFAFRALAKSPAFTATALLSLALGIGANTAMFSFVDAILMRALPVADPEQLAICNWRAEGWPKVAHSQHGTGYADPGGIAVAGTFPYPFFASLGNHNQAFSSIFGFAAAGRPNLVAGKQAFVAEGEYVSGNYFNALGVAPAAGRLIGNEDDLPASIPVAVISYRMWQQRFDGAGNTAGQIILVNREPFTIAGVAAPNFYGVDSRNTPDIYLPIHLVPSIEPRAERRDWIHERNNYWVEIMGRLRPEVGLRQADALMAGLYHSFVTGTARNDNERANLPRLWLQPGGSGTDFLRRTYAKPLYVLFTMTGLILAIACSNIANLLLSRATGRRREIAVRLSLGAGRGRIIRQLLTENILLAFAGGLIGLFVAALTIRFLAWLLANGRETFTLHAAIDGRILLFASLLCLTASLVFGLFPALQATKVDVAPTLKESRAAELRVRRFGLPFGFGHALVAGQIALSLLLVIADGLFVRTLANLRSVSIGFNAEKLLVFDLDAKRAGYNERRAAEFYESLRQRLEAIPGVRAATMSDMPLASNSSNSEGIEIPGKPAPADHPLSTDDMLVGPSFFETMQIPILLGRAIGEQDTADAPRVVVVNEVFAKKFFSGRDVLGRHFTLNNDVQIVGIARNSVFSSLKEEIPPVVYLPWSQTRWVLPGMYYELRTAGDPLSLANTVRQVVHRADPSIPVADLTTQVRHIDGTISTERTFADLCTWFGSLALLIAAIGIYGTMSYAVARRANEIGIRLALGAQRRTVMWMVQREVLILASIGLAIGLLIAWQTARLISSFLYGVGSNDFLVFGASAAILTICALAAACSPAWRASHIDPMQALRNE